jgi:hypothetical protein
MLINQYFKAVKLSSDQKEIGKNFPQLIPSDYSNSWDVQKLSDSCFFDNIEAI